MPVQQPELRIRACPWTGHGCNAAGPVTGRADGSLGSSSAGSELMVQVVAVNGVDVAPGALARSTFRAADGAVGADYDNDNVIMKITISILNTTLMITKMII